MTSEHYFSQQPKASGNRHIIEVTLRGFELRLVTEAGVFSRARVDAGTRLFIKQLEVQPDDRILDLGCGYGAVGIVAAKLASQGHVTLVDINKRAVAVARENLTLNRVANAKVVQGDGFAPLAGCEFTLIALNPPIRAGKVVVHRLIEQAAQHLTVGGRFWLVARTKQGAVRLSEKMSVVFGNVTEVAKGGGYRIYQSQR